MVTFPYRGILQYKSGCAANGLRPSTGSPSLLEQSWSFWPVLPAASFVTLALPFPPASPSPLPCHPLYVSVVIPWSTCNSLHWAGFFMLLCLCTYLSICLGCPLSPVHFQSLAYPPKSSPHVTCLMKSVKSILFAQPQHPCKQPSFLLSPCDTQNSLITQNWGIYFRGVPFHSTTSATGQWQVWSVPASQRPAQSLTSKRWRAQWPMKGVPGLLIEMQTDPP